MNHGILSLVMAAVALTAGAGAHADVRLNVGVSPFGWGVPPPVVYESPRYYGPPVVYYGGGRWGDHRGGRGYDRGHSGHRR